MFLVVDEDGAGFGAEALAAAVGAEGVAAVFGEEDADVQLVFLALERGEEAADAGEGAAAFLDEVLLVGGRDRTRGRRWGCWRLWRRGSSRRGAGGTWSWSRGRWRPAARVFDLSGMMRLGSKSMVLPKPWQRGQAP